MMRAVVAMIDVNFGVSEVEKPTAPAAAGPTMRALLGLLFLVGLVIAYWQWVLAAIVLVMIVKAAPVAYREWQADLAPERQRLRGLIARADQQHLWAMSGDPRGVHGNYPPALRAEPF
jgi:hypothetical protein